MSPFGVRERQLERAIQVMPEPGNRAQRVVFLDSDNRVACHAYPLPSWVRQTNWVQNTLGFFGLPENSTH